MDIFTGFTFWVGLCVAVGIWASNRGRNGIGWFFISVVVSPVLGFIFLAVLEDLSKQAGGVNAVGGPAGQPLSGGYGRPGSAGIASAAPTPTDADYAFALAEVSSEQRRPGVWAKAYAEALGDNDRAVAYYTQRRAQEQATERAAHEADDLRKTEEGRAWLARQAYEAMPKGTCPNCGTVIPLDAALCPVPKCGASFDAPDGWRIKPLGT